VPEARSGVETPPGRTLGTSRACELLDTPLAAPKVGKKRRRTRAPGRRRNRSHMARSQCESECQARIERATSINADLLKAAQPLRSWKSTRKEPD